MFLGLQLHRSISGNEPSPAHDRYIVWVSNMQFIRYKSDVFPSITLSGTGRGIRYRFTAIHHS